MGVAIAIVNAISLNRPTVLVGKQAELDAFAVAELLQCLHRVETDADNLRSSCLNSIQILLQLNQLALAEESPIRRAVEDQRNATFLQQLFECVLLAVLVSQTKRLEPFLQSRSDWLA